MLDATLYLAGRDAKTGEIIPDTTSCSMCRRLIINSGIKKIVCRVGENEYKSVNVRDWIFDDDSMPFTVL